MSPKLVRPFESIEDTQEFIELLTDAIGQAAREVQEETEQAHRSSQPRRAEAFQLAHYKLEQLALHVRKSRRIMNDLRMIRRMLANERG